MSIQSEMNEPRDLTETEKNRFERWIIENVTASVVPPDERNSDALVFNLVHLLRGDEEMYDYLPKQDAELVAWGLMEEL